MATLHSFPQELIRHTLALAYPPGAPGSGRGLSRAARVHSSWVNASSSLLTEQISFTKLQKRSLTRFVERGPTGYASQVVSFWACPEYDVKVVLGKARAGGIKKLKLYITTKRMISGLFNFASLSKLRGFELVVDYKPRNYKNPLVDSTQVKLDFGSWPTQLQQLAISSPIIPFGLVDSSADTLTTLDLHLAQGDRADEVESLSWCCPNVATLTLRKPTSIGDFELPDEITAFVGSLLSLSSLTLTHVWPHQLEQLLLALDSGQELAQLAVSVWSPSDDIEDFGPYDQDRATDEWEPTLRQCLKAPALAKLRRWRMSLRSSLNPSGRREGGADEFEDWADEGRWSAFPGELEASGIELVLGPLGD